MFSLYLGLYTCIVIFLLNHIHAYIYIYTLHTIYIFFIYSNKCISARQNLTGICSVGYSCMICLFIVSNSIYKIFIPLGYI